jgi:hypothetical protein
MPIKARRAKARQLRITPEAVQGFEAGDVLALHRALGLRPWQASPLDVDGPEPPAWAGRTAWAASWPPAAELRAELERACTRG